MWVGTSATERYVLPFNVQNFNVNPHQFCYRKPYFTESLKSIKLVKISGRRARISRWGTPRQILDSVPAVFVAPFAPFPA